MFNRTSKKLGRILLGTSVLALSGAAQSAVATGSEPGASVNQEFRLLHGPKALQLAQAATSGPAISTAEGDAAGQGAGGDQEIVVTAQRRAELSRDVPITMTTINQELITRANVRSLADITQLSPGVRFDSQGTNVQPTIRGVSTPLSFSGAGANVGIYVDGFYSPNPSAADTLVFNVSSIQVLKGPQGTLFGRNTTGGAILITTNKPSTDFKATAEAAYGSYNDLRLQAYATAGLSEKIAVDIAGSYRRGDGYTTNIVNGDDKIGKFEHAALRLGIKTDFSDRFSTLFRYSRTDIDDPGRRLLVPYVDRNGTIMSAATRIPGAIIATAPKTVARLRRDSFQFKGNVFQFTATADLDFAELNSYTQYRTEYNKSVNDNDYTAAPLQDLSVPIKDRIFTQEVILTSKPGKLQWTAGAFYFYNWNKFLDSRLGLNGGPLTLISRIRTKTVGVALFGDVTYEAVENLFITGGLRYSIDKVKDPQIFSGPLSGNRGLINFPGTKKSQFTPRFVVRYKPTDQSSVYASYTRGFKAGVINVNVVPDYVRPEKLEAFEVGFKYGDRTISIDTAAFYYNYQDLQVSSFTGLQAITNNAAAARMYGAELQARYNIGNGWSASGGVAYLNAKYKDFRNAAVFRRCSSVETCPAGTFPAQVGTFPNAIIDASGNPLQRAPAFTGNIGVQYTTELANGRLNLSGNLYHTSKFYFDPAKLYVQKAYSLLGARAEWTDPSDHITLAVYGENITNSKYRTSLLSSGSGAINTWATPASFGGSIRYKF